MLCVSLFFFDVVELVWGRLHQLRSRMRVYGPLHQKLVDRVNYVRFDMSVLLVLFNCIENCSMVTYLTTMEIMLQRS